MPKNAAGSRARPQSATGRKKSRWTAKERADRGRRPSRRPGQDQSRPRQDQNGADTPRPSGRSATDRRYDNSRRPDLDRRADSDRRTDAGRSSNDRRYSTDRRPDADRRTNGSRDGRPYGQDRRRPDDRRTQSDRPWQDRGSRDDRGRSFDRTARTDRPRQDRSRDERSAGDRTRTERYGSGRPRSNDGFGDDRSRSVRSDSDRYGNDRTRDDRGRQDRFDRDRRPDRPRNDRSGEQRRESRPGDAWHRSMSDDTSRTDRRDNDFRRNDGRRNDGRRNDDRGWDDRRQDARRSHDRRRDDRHGDDRPGSGDRGRYGRPEVDETEDQDLMTWGGDEAEAVEGDAGDSGFAAFGLPEPLLSALAGAGITQPFPIQSATIPDALAGRDVLGRAQTGSGKTLGFGLPLLSRLAESGTGSKLPRALILVPTRELAVQVADALAPLARTVGLSVTLVAGGMPYGPQRRAFERGVDVVVATPGRMIDLLDQAACDLTEVEITVLDEADHMADLGFLPDVKTLLDAVPAGGQRLLFSATLDSGIDRLVKTYLADPVTHQVDSDRASVTTMSHHVVHVQPRDKTVLTAELASREGRTVIFVRTQRGADRIAEQLRAEGVLAGALHGGLSQGARSRILAAFKDGRIPALVATDVAARGIHVDEVGLVLQVDPPAGPKEYLHRAGRTARAGGSGVVVTLVLPHQRRELDRLTRQAGVKATSIAGTPGDAELAEATGARTPSRDAVSESDYQRLISPPPSRKGRGRPNGSRPFRGRRPDSSRRAPRRSGARAETWG